MSGSGICSNRSSSPRQNALVHANEWNGMLSELGRSSARGVIVKFYRPKSARFLGDFAGNATLFSAASGPFGMATADETAVNAFAPIDGDAWERVRPTRAHEIVSKPNDPTTKLIVGGKSVPNGLARTAAEEREAGA